MMKKRIIILLQIILILLSAKLNSQSVNWLTPGGTFDQVYDKNGNVYALADLALIAGKPIGGGSTVQAIPTASCSSGYFDLYFAVGSCFDGNSQAAIDKRTVLCKVFSDVSAFITSPLSAPSNTVRINIYCCMSSNQSELS